MEEESAKPLRDAVCVKSTDLIAGERARPNSFSAVCFAGIFLEKSTMPALQLIIPHRLGQEEALVRLKNLLGKVKQRYQTQVGDLQETWTENVVQFGFKTYGFAVSGQMAVEPSDVRFDAKIPMAAMMFKGKIEQTLRDEINRVLA
jgi:hypothetical protein